MLVFKPLKRRAIALLWGGQVLSSIGDEIYGVAMVWLATGLVGVNAGYVTAMQAASVFVFSLIGGIWADHWDHRSTMIRSDIIRGFAVLIPPLFSYFAPPSLLVLTFVGVVISSLSAFFNPALRATVPELVESAELLQATNGLMETTYRFARVIGPGFIALLNAIVPIIHFFTIDAITFFLSAFTISRLRSQFSAPVKRARTQLTLSAIREGLLSGWQAIQSHALLRYTICMGALVNSCWYLIYPLAITLLLRQTMPGNIAALGSILAAYGVGNISSNLIVGSLTIREHKNWSFSGRIIIGLGFVGLAFAPSLPLMMLAAAISATAGPITDLAFIAMVQKDIAKRDFAKVYRLSMALTHGAVVVLLAFSPLLFRAFQIKTVIAGAGSFMAFAGVLGFYLFRRRIA